MKKKDWITEKIKSNDKPLAYRCFTTTTMPIISKFMTTATIESNTDVEYVEPNCEMERLRADIAELSKRLLALDGIVKRLYDKLSFYII